MAEDKFLTKIRRQGSGLHLYFTTEVLNNPNFTLQEGDIVLITLNKGGIGIKKVDIEKLTGKEAPS